MITIDTQYRTNVECPIFVPGINFYNPDRFNPIVVDTVLSDLDILLPQSQLTVDVQSRHVNPKLNGHVHNPFGFTKLPSVHNRYDSTRVGQR